MVFYRLVFVAVLGRVLTYLWVRWDYGRLDAAARERAWNAATMGSAIWLWPIGPACLLAWGFVTREKWWKGLLLGALGFVVVAIGMQLVDLGMAYAFGWPLDLDEAMFRG